MMANPEAANHCPTIYDEIQRERDHQDQKWGHAFDDQNTGHDWQAYMNNQLARGFSYFADIDPRTAMLKAAAVAVAALEAYDRNGGFPSSHQANGPTGL